MNLKLCRKVSSQLQLYANKKVFTLASCLFPFFQLDHVVFLLFHSHVYIRGHYQHHERKSPFRKSHHLKVEEKQICKKYCQHLSDSICLCLQNDAFFKVNKRIYLSVYLRLMSVKMKKFSSFLSLGWNPERVDARCNPKVCLHFQPLAETCAHRGLRTINEFLPFFSASYCKSQKNTVERTLGILARI